MSTEKNKHKVLIVDDTPENIQVLMNLLQDHYAIAVANNGERALKLALSSPPPDIILLDVMMPVMDGYEVCRRLKSDKSTASIPVIFVTGLSDHADEQRGLEMGAVDYIHKPFTPSLVMARLKNQLELKKHRDNLEDIVNERTRDLALTQDAAIFGLGILAEYRDTETGEHIHRTQHFVKLLGERLRNHPKFAGYFTNETLRQLFTSAPLHDIGKVGVPDAVLHKPFSLTEQEFKIIRQHTRLGREVIRRIERGMFNNTASSFLHFAEEMTYTHHERWDGSGYHNMKGDEIPVSGRLMALADVYDALTSARVYKPAYPHELAMKIITQGDGRTSPSHFDPFILQAFIDLEEDIKRVAASYRDRQKKIQAQ